MGHTRYYSYSCDVDKCHNVVVAEWVEFVTVGPTENGLPEGWTIIQQTPTYRVYVCKQCVEGEKFRDVLKVLFPPRVVPGIDLGVGSAAYITPNLQIDNQTAGGILNTTFTP